MVKDPSSIIPREPLIKLRPYQRAAFRHKLRRLFMLWSRQKGKSFLLGAQGLDWMMEMQGVLVTFISASIMLGEEILLKEVSVWMQMLEVLRKAADGAGLKLTSNADGLDFDAVCDIFEHSKLETKLWHTRTICSRSRVIAPNPDTAVGWTGHIIGDEVGRWPNAQEVFEAILPIMDSHPEYKMRLATTPPPDDKHYTFTLFMPPAGITFEHNPMGNWYKSEYGIPCHRVDAWDAHLAGVMLTHPDTKAVCTPEEHRACFPDKAAWDRNYALLFLAGGTAAISLTAISNAQAKGIGQCLGVNITEALGAA
ncbi:MAG: hypothetical protein ACOYOU_01020 [Kiritimatiellia bacterium]